MRKYRRTLRQRLDNNRKWAYQEIMVEALVVLWIACEISAKLGTRIYPQWRTTRVDPSRMSETGKNLLRLVNGENGCVWDSMVSTWKQSAPITTASDETTGVVTSTTRAVVGYVATFAAICTTAILGVSVGLSLFVNRHWRFPRFTQHLPCCQRITAFFGYDKNRQDYWADYKDPNVPRIVFLLLHLVLLGANFACFVWVWLAVCALPVVSVSRMLVLVTINNLGEEATFPCWVLFVCVLSVHCTGRIWGVWMPECYSTRIRNETRAFSKDKLQSDFRTKQSMPHRLLGAMQTTNDMPRKEKRARRGCFLSYTAFVVALACSAVISNTPSPQFALPDDIFSTLINSTTLHAPAANWTNGTLMGHNDTESCLPSPKTRFTETQAMLSYWVNFTYDGQNTSNASINTELLASFSPSFSPVVEWLFMLWCFLLLLISGMPPILLGLLEVIVLGGLIAIGLIGVTVVLAIVVWRYVSRFLVAVFYRVWYGKSRSKCRRYGHWFDFEADHLRRASGAPDQPDYICKECGEEFFHVGITGCCNEATGSDDRVSSGVVDSQLSITDTTGTNHPASQCDADEQQSNITAERMVLEASKDRTSKKGAAAFTAIDCTAMSACPPFCVCSTWASLQCAAISLTRQMLCWLCLPFPIVGFFLPERLQLPGLLLLLTAYMLWNYWELISVLWWNSREEKADEAAEKRANGGNQEKKEKGDVRKKCAGSWLVMKDRTGRYCEGPCMKFSAS
ncbi:uncharacterized protein LOC129596296 [Paramacrobiotus metropolitanus]|uniref:uncharacterized protein LOC129596296 n=1 Tax=Paramacrobiotus metropolitanus TaxID=2943436 RepID=UPI00244649A6|nr:uncharacterized protein LOC129596296 [Paramacrobiotus metropolitanus]